jgi:chromosome segregation ATPase
MSSPRSSRHGQQVPRRLAPIDHVRALYEGAVKSMDPDRPCAIVHKKDLIDAVRRVSPTNRDRSPKIVLKKNNAGGGGGGHGKSVTDLEGNAGKSEITNLEECINVHARRYNNLKAKCEKKQHEVDRLMDQLAGLDKEIESLQKMEKNDTPETVRIQELRKKIKEVEGEIEGKRFVRQQLEFMLRRLRDDEVVMNAKVLNMEDALDASKKEYGEVKTLLRDLEAKKRASVVELQRVQLEVSVARKQRSRQLAERRQQASNAKRMEEWRKSREKARKGGAGDDMTSNSNDDDSKGSENDGDESGKKGKSHAKIEINREMTLEEAFTQIRQATVC